MEAIWGQSRDGKADRASMDLGLSWLGRCNMDNPIEAAIEADTQKSGAGAAGAVGKMASKYTLDSSQLLGFLLSLTYDEMRIVTCDAWKTMCGGVPRNSFAIVKANPKAAGAANAGLGDRSSWRVSLRCPNPSRNRLQQTIFQVPQVQALLDPLTNKELQWGALRGSILGTYYDDDGLIAFGNDVDTFLAPHSYEVYVPEAADLETLINSFVASDAGVRLGRLRYTETPTPATTQAQVEVLVDPMDFVGRESGNRTALFGKTRMGKSNAIKLIADAIFASPAQAAQLIFDPSGEYTYVNEQDSDSSLFSQHRDRSIRYSLSPRLSTKEQSLGLALPLPLRVDFFSSPTVGHSLIRALFASRFPNRPNYISDVLEWEPPEPSQIPSKQADAGRHCREWRELGIWWAVLDAASYNRPTDNGTFGNIPVELQKAVKESSAARPDLPPQVRIDTSKGPLACARVRDGQIPEFGICRVRR